MTHDNPQNKSSEPAPDCWLLIKNGVVTDLFTDRKQAEFFAGFSADKLRSIYLDSPPSPAIVKMVEALETVKTALESDHAIADTLWAPNSRAPETLLDHVCAALDAYRNQKSEQHTDDEQKQGCEV